MLVNNIASWTVKIVPADLPFSQRRGRRPAPRHAPEDGALGDPDDARQRPGLPLRPRSRGAGRAGEDRPARLGVGRRAARGRRVGETRREYPDGPLLSQVVGYTGAIDGGTYDRLKPKGYLADDIIGKAGVEGIIRVGAARHLRQGARRARRDRSRRPGSPDAPAVRSRRVAHADDRQDDPEGGDRRPQVGDARRRAQARRVHRDEPADGRGPRAREPADLRQQPVLRWHFLEGLQAPRREQERAADEPGRSGQLPARIDLQARHRHGRRWPTRRSPRPRSSGRAGT